MIGRFIIECDSENLRDAQEAIEFLLENPDEKEVCTSSKVDGNPPVTMFAARLKKSIRVRQVSP